MPTKLEQAKFQWLERQRVLKQLASRERNLNSKSERLRELAIVANEALDEIFQRSNDEQEFNSDSNMPKSGHIKGNWGDIGKARCDEATTLGGFKSDQTKKSRKKL